MPHAALQSDITFVIFQHLNILRVCVRVREREERKTNEWIESSRCQKLLYIKIFSISPLWVQRQYALVLWSDRWVLFLVLFSSIHFPRALLGLFAATLCVDYAPSTRNQRNERVKWKTNRVFEQRKTNSRRTQHFTCKWFQFCSSSLTAFSVSLISLCVSAHSAFNVVCNALYACRTKRKPETQREKKVNANLLIGVESEEKRCAYTFFFSSHSSVSRTIFSFSGCNSCINAETRSRAAATARVKCATRREISITDDASFNGFTSSGRPLVSPPPLPPPSNLSAGM